MWNWCLRSLISRIFVDTSPVSPDPKVLLFFSSCLSLSLHWGEDMGQPFGRFGYFLGPLRGAGLAEARRRDPVALCFGGRAARTHAPVNGLSKDNFCFSFAVGSCPATSNEKCAFSRDSGAGDLCGNRNHPRGLGCSAGFRGVEGWGGPGRKPGALAPPAPAFTAPPHHPYLQDILQPLPQEAERFIAVK